MGQVTIYIDDQMHEKIKAAAKSNKLSVSKWLSGLVKKELATEWPNEVLHLAGCWSDDDFPTIEEIRSNYGKDCPRESF